METPAIDEIPGTDRGLEAALRQGGLPVDDLSEPGRRFFRFSVRERLVGFVGWEEVGESVALLRSLVVMPSERGYGWGGVMAAWALRRLTDLGFSDAWVLTLTAERLVVRLGFVPVDRPAAPDVVRRSRQFAGLCPTSAALLHRRLITGQNVMDSL